MLSLAMGRCDVLSFPPIRQIKQGLIDRVGEVVMVSGDLRKILRSRYRNTKDVRVIPMGAGLGFYGPEHREVHSTFRGPHGREEGNLLSSRGDEGALREDSSCWGRTRKG